MAGGIKGITVKIGGDTTELGRALTSAHKASTALQRELKGVNTLLKYDPKNVTLLKQKQDLLKKSIEETKTKLDSLKEVMAKVDSGEIEMTEEEYRNLQREIASTENKLKDLTKQQEQFGSVGAQRISAMGEQFKTIGGKMESAGRSLMPLSGAIAGLGAISVKTTADFDSSMSKVGAISGATGKEFDKLRDKAREMGSKTKFSASESADAMSYMAMAGWKTSDMLDGLEGVMMLASASGEDLATTSDILTDGLTAFGLSAKDSGRMADVMASASSNANTNVSMLGESYKYCASTAGAMGYSLEDVTESLGLMANAGVKGSQAGTTLKNAMINLAKPTAQMQSAMDKYGISITNSDGSMKSWNEVVDNLRGSLSGLSEAEQTSAVATLFGKEATAGMLSVINAGPKDIEKLNKAINNSTGSAKEMADAMNDNLSGQLTILKSQLQELAISFGDVLMPVIRGIVEHFQKFIDKLNGMSDGQRKVVLVIMGIVASIGPLLLIGGKLMIFIGQIMTFAPQIIGIVSKIGTVAKGLFAVLAGNPIALIIIGITALVAGLIYAYKHSEKFRDIVNTAFSKVKEVVGKVVDALKTFFTETIPGAIDTMVGFFTGIGDKIHSAITSIVVVVKSVFNSIKTVVTNIFNGIKTVITTAWSFYVTIITTYINIIKTVVTTVFNAVKTVISTVFNAIKTVIVNAWNFYKGIITKVAGAIKSVVTKAWNGIKSITSKVWSSLKSIISTPINGAKNLVTSAVTALKSKVTSVFNSLKSSVKSIFNGIKTAITGPINSAKNTVSNVVNSIKSKVKGIFNGIKPKLHLSLPKIHVSGGKAPFGIGGKGSLPKFNVTWNKLGAIFKKPTIFNTPQGFQGVGEAGPEAVAPISELMGYVRTAVNDSDIGERIGRLETLLSEYLPGIASGKMIVLDTGTLVGETIDAIDLGLSDKSNLIKRGW